MRTTEPTILPVVNNSPSVVFLPHAIGFSAAQLVMLEVKGIFVVVVVEGDCLVFLLDLLRCFTLISSRYGLNKC